MAFTWCIARSVRFLLKPVVAIYTTASLMFASPVPALAEVDTAQAQELIAVDHGVKCGTIKSRKPNSVNYCLRVRPRSKNLLVYLHGVTKDEKWIFADRDPSLKDLKISEPDGPSILSLSFGRYKFFARPSLNGTARMLKATISEINSLIQDAQSRSRATSTVLLGESMGGFNAFQIFLRLPDLFDRVALNCPAIAGVSPFAPDSVWTSDPDYYSANALLRTGFRALMKIVFRNDLIWNHESPLGYLQNQFQYSKADRVPFYIGTVEQDGFGFINAVDRLARELRARNFPVRTHKTTGTRHCVVDSLPLSKFVLHEGH